MAISGKIKSAQVFLNDPEVAEYKSLFKSKIVKIQQSQLSLSHLNESIDKLKLKKIEVRNFSNLRCFENTGPGH